MVAIMLTLTGCADEETTLEGKTFYAGYEYDPDQFYFHFQENGKIKICQDKGAKENCCCNGEYEELDKGFKISGISNPNCPHMKKLNGTYDLCSDCIPADKGYMMNAEGGTIRAWPKED